MHHATFPLIAALLASSVAMPRVAEACGSSGPDGVSAKGSYELRMSDYGITPPTLMLGAIKVLVDLDSVDSYYAALPNVGRGPDPHLA